jgi:alkaline phosphatase
MQSRKLVTIVTFLVVLTFGVCIGFTGCDSAQASQATENDSSNGKAKYVFLFIGDGMSNAQLNSAAIYKAALEGNNTYDEYGNCTYVQQPDALNISSLPVVGMTTTYSRNSYITDSAAAATALACGQKTDSGIISMNYSKDTVFKTIAEQAKEKGMKVGIVSSVSIDHATPACFYAHNESRNNYYSIGQGLLDSDFDYFAGGSVRDNKYKNEGYADYTLESFIEDAVSKGFTYANSREEFEALSSSSGKVIATTPTVDSSKALPYELVRDTSDDSDDISLAEFTEKGIKLLKNNRKGFFMMVEGGKIDWACHANDAGSAIHDTLAFDEAVGKALEFYRRHPKQTLIIVTGDHECGGMTNGFAGTAYSTYYEKIQRQKVSYDVFDAMVSSMSHSSLTDLYDVIETNFGLDMDEDGNGLTLSSFERSQLETAYNDMNVTNRTEEQQLLYGGYNTLSVTITHILNRKAGIGWTSYSHTGAPVPTYARGVNQDLFTGFYDNTDIHAKLKSVIGVN